MEGVGGAKVSGLSTTLAVRGVMHACGYWSLKKTKYFVGLPNPTLNHHPDSIPG